MTLVTWTSIVFSLETSLHVGASAGRVLSTSLPRWPENRAEVGWTPGGRWRPGRWTTWNLEL